MTAVRDTPDLPGYRITELLRRTNGMDVYRARAEETGGSVLIRVPRGASEAPAPYAVVREERPDSLGALLESQGALPADRVAEAGLAVAVELEALHEAGMVHNGISPGTLLFRGGGAELAPTLVPALRSGEPFPPLVLTGKAAAHLPPEASGSGPATPRSDVYRLASTMWTLLTGRAPDNGGPSGGGDASPSGEAGGGTAGTADPPMPRALELLLRRALDRNPRNRPADAGAFARALADADAADGTGRLKAPVGTTRGDSDPGTLTAANLPTEEASGEHPVDGGGGPSGGPPGEAAADRTRVAPSWGAAEPTADDPADPGPATDERTDGATTVSADEPVAGGAQADDRVFRMAGHDEPVADSAADTVSFHEPSVPWPAPIIHDAEAPPAADGGALGPFPEADASEASAQAAVAEESVGAADPATGRTGADHAVDAAPAHDEAGTSGTAPTALPAPAPPEPVGGPADSGGAPVDRAGTAVDSAPPERGSGAAADVNDRAGAGRPAATAPHGAADGSEPHIPGSPPQRALPDTGGRGAAVALTSDGGSPARAAVSGPGTGHLPAADGGDDGDGTATGTERVAAALGGAPGTGVAEAGAGGSTRVERAGSAGGGLGRMALTAVLAASLVIAVLGAVALAVAWWSAPRTGEPPAAESTSEASPPSSEVPPAAAENPRWAPTDVGIRSDTLDTVTLSWTDNTQGRASFHVVGGPVGTTPGTLAEAEALGTQVEITGLNPTFDYCFTVVAVLSVDEVASSRNICTSRFAEA